MNDPEQNEVEAQPSRQQRRAEEREQAKNLESINKTLNKFRRLHSIQSRQPRPNTMQPNGFTREQ
jgi:hypothetical protein